MAQEARPHALCKSANYQMKEQHGNLSARFSKLQQTKRRRPSAFPPFYAWKNLTNTLYIVLTAFSI